jgi:8-oxo-dGTP diphosphatase
MKEHRKKSHIPILAAGGIVVRTGHRPSFAVVQMRKFDVWVLPKGKLDDGETAREAAQREATEETGFDVAVHEFIGTIAYDVGARPKIVHFWRMTAIGEGPVSELMDDVQAMQWLPLDEAIDQLSHLREREFLRQVGPIVLAALSGSQPGAISDRSVAPVAALDGSSIHQDDRRVPAPVNDGAGVHDGSEDAVAIALAAHNGSTPIRDPAPSRGLLVQAVRHWMTRIAALRSGNRRP